MICLLYRDPTTAGFPRVRASLDRLTPIGTIQSHEHGVRFEWKSNLCTKESELFCRFQTVRWGECTGPAAYIYQRNSRRVTNTRMGYQGSAVFTCNNRQWHLREGSANCRAVSTCPTQTRRWGGCWGRAVAGPANTLRIVNNTRAGYQGNARYRCTNGQWVFQQGSATCRPTNTNQCPSQTLRWGDCWGPTNEGPLNTLRTVNNTRAGYQGNARYRCTNGQWVFQQGSATCRPSNTNQCPTQTVRWMTNCTGDARGTYFHVYNISRNYTGAAKYQCINGRWSNINGAAICHQNSGGFHISLDCPQRVTSSIYTITVYNRSRQNVKMCRLWSFEMNDGFKSSAWPVSNNFCEDFFDDSESKLLRFDLGVDIRPNKSLHSLWLVNNFGVRSNTVSCSIDVDY